mmetsp:Transcript_47672/g.123622  ORF Transcript_47672/g.123622 Transcript_47672/m.123622 type:complete len:388 (+) Transcript_47672:975-2138(+)
MLILFTSFANVTPVISSICSLIIKPKYLAMIGGCIMTTGYLLFAFSTPYFEAYEVGSAIIGFGYSVCFLPLFSVAFREPGWTHIVYPLIVGSFDFSAFTMFIFYSLHFTVGVTVSQYFFFMAGGALLSTFCILWILKEPKQQKQQSVNEKTETTKLLPHEEGQAQTPQEPEKKTKGEQVKDNLKMLGNSLKQGKFWVITAWTSMYMTSKYFYIDTLNQQLFWLQNESKTESAEEFDISLALGVFSIVLPAAALLSPFTSLITKKGGAKSVVMIMVVLSSIIAVTGNVAIMELQYVTMSLVVYNRLLFFGIAPVVMTQVYPQEIAIAVYGISLTCAALVNYTGYLWSYIALSVAHSFFAVNMALNCCAAVSGMSLFVFLFLSGKRKET